MILYASYGFSSIMGFGQLCESVKHAERDMFDHIMIFFFK